MILFGCSKSNESNFIHRVNIEKIQDSVCMADIVDSVRYIKLDKKDGCQIGNIKQTIVYKDKIYVISNGVFCFDIKGKYLYSINKKGHSRNEYIDICNVNIIDKEIYIFDNFSNKVLIFDSNNGHFIKNVELPFGISSVYGLKDIFVIDRHSLPYEDVKNDERFLLCSQNDIHDIKDVCFEEDEFKLVVNGTLTPGHDGLIFTSFLRSKAWKISNKGCSQFMEVNIPFENQLSEAVIEKSIKDQSLPTGDVILNKVYGLSNVYESGIHIVGRLSIGNEFLYFIYNKSNKKTICYKRIAKAEPWQFLPVDFCSSDGKSFYTIISSDDISFVRSICGTGNKPQERDVPNYEIFCEAKDSDNPVVAQFFLK